MNKTFTKSIMPFEDFTNNLNIHKLVSNPGKQKYIHDLTDEEALTKALSKLRSDFQNKHKRKKRPQTGNIRQKSPVYKQFQMTILKMPFKQSFRRRNSSGQKKIIANCHKQQRIGKELRQQSNTLMTNYTNFMFQAKFDSKPEVMKPRTRGGNKRG